MKSWIMQGTNMNQAAPDLEGASSEVVCNLMDMIGTLTGLIALYLVRHLFIFE